MTVPALQVVGKHIAQGLNILNKAYPLLLSWKKKQNLKTNYWLIKWGDTIQQPNVRWAIFLILIYNCLRDQTKGRIPNIFRNGNEHSGYITNKGIRTSLQGHVLKSTIILDASASKRAVFDFQHIRKGHTPPPLQNFLLGLWLPIFNLWELKRKGTGVAIETWGFWSPSHKR